MSKAFKIFGLTLLIGGGAAFALYKKNEDKIKGNLIVDVTFKRVHGLVDNILSNLLSPVIKLIFNITIDNKTGLPAQNLKKVSLRIENKKPNSNWEIIGNTPNYLEISTQDGKIDTKELEINIKGYSTIAALRDSKNKQRAVLNYDWNGISMLPLIIDLNISQSFSQYWNKIKSKLGK